MLFRTPALCKVAGAGFAFSLWIDMSVGISQSRESWSYRGSEKGSFEASRDLGLRE